jgi:hypothetical protein
LLTVISRCNCSPRLDFSIFRYFNMVIRIKFLSRVSNGFLSFSLQNPSSHLDCHRFLQRPCNSPANSRF